MIAQHQTLANSPSTDLEEAAALRLGNLKVSYYKARDGQQASHDEPVQSHFKLTIVDGEIAVFGSGNMDRPSWYTSQELGVAFFDREFVAKVEMGVKEALSGRRKIMVWTAPGMIFGLVLASVSFHCAYSRISLYLFPFPN